MGAVPADSRCTTADNETAPARRYTTSGVSTVQWRRILAAKPVLGILRSHDTARRDICGGHRFPRTSMSPTASRQRCNGCLVR